MFYLSLKPKKNTLKQKKLNFFLNSISYNLLIRGSNKTLNLR